MSESPKNERLVRYSHPTRLDIAPYGKIWESIINDDFPVLYIQASTDEHTPNWIRLGDFLERAFVNLLHEESFIQECLKLHQKKRPIKNFLKTYIEE